MHSFFIIMSTTEGIIAKDISKKKASDAGMAAVLILLLLGLFLKNDAFYKWAIPGLIINMIVPKFYYPFAVLWFTLSNLLGTVVSKILLSVIFFVLVTPIGLLRRAFGKDSLYLKKFKKGKESVLNKRDYLFTAEDIKHPY